MSNCSWLQVSSEDGKKQ